MSGHLEVGDRIVEVTPSGRRRHHIVVAVDVEVKYPQPGERYVTTAEDRGPGHDGLAESAVFEEDYFQLEEEAPLRLGGPDAA